MNSSRSYFQKGYLLAAIVVACVLSACSSSTEPEPKTRVLTSGSASGDFVLRTTSIGYTHDTTFVLKNTGNDSVTISSITTSDKVLTIVDLNTPVTIAAGKELAVKVRFAPEDTLEATHTVMINSNSKDTVITLTFRGKGNWYHVAKGSTFTYNAVSTDSTGAEIESAVVATIIDSTDLTYQGKSDVVKVLDGADTTYFHYEANGDISIYNAGVTVDVSGKPNGAGWITLPFKSEEKNKQVIYDSSDVSIDYQGTPLPGILVISAIASYDGSELVTVGSEEISVDKVVMNVDIKFDISSIKFFAKGTYTYYYSSKLGYLVKQESKLYSNIPGRPPFEGGVKTLVSYNLK